MRHSADPLSPPADPHPLSLRILTLLVECQLVAVVQVIPNSAAAVRIVPTVLPVIADPTSAATSVLSISMPSAPLFLPRSVMG
jgi:hypothetical protein